MSRLPPTDLRLFRDDPDAPAAHDPERWRFLPTALRGARADRADREAVRLLTEAAFRPLDGN